MNNRQLIKYAANRMLAYRVKQALSVSDITSKLPTLDDAKSTFNKYKSNLILPGVGAAAGGLYAALTNDSRLSLKEKLKRIIRNSAIGAGIGGIGELGRLGYAQKVHDKITDTISDAKDYIHEKTSAYKKKTAGLNFDKSHLILPAVGAGVSGLATLIGMRNNKDSLKNKLKRLLRNVALGTTVGTGLELSRVGVKNLISPKEEIDGGAIVDSNFINE